MITNRYLQIPVSNSGHSLISESIKGLFVNNKSSIFSERVGNLIIEQVNFYGIIK